MNKTCIIFITCQKNYNNKLKELLLDPIYNSIKDNNNYDFHVIYNKPNEKSYDLFLENINVFNISQEHLNNIYPDLGINLNSMTQYNYNDMDMVYEFYKQYNNYDYYWVIEDDVFFTGYWNILFDFYKDYNIDLLACHNTDYIFYPYSFNALNDTLGFDFFDKNNYLLSFLAICRLSNNLINKVINGPLSKKCFQEVQVGSTCKYYNLSYFDILNFSIDTSNNERINYGSVRWEHYDNKELINLNYLNTENLLVHPIKEDNYILIE